MTARHIDATDKTDGSHVVKILWNENDSERELTVRMPAAGTDATDRVDVDLLPVPGEDPATTFSTQSSMRTTHTRAGIPVEALVVSGFSCFCIVRPFIACLPDRPRSP